MFQYIKRHNTSLWILSVLSYRHWVTGDFWQEMCCKLWRIYCTLSLQIYLLRYTSLICYLLINLVMRRVGFYQWGEIIYQWGIDVLYSYTVLIRVAKRGRSYYGNKNSNLVIRQPLNVWVIWHIWNSVIFHHFS